MIERFNDLTIEHSNNLTILQSNTRILLVDLVDLDGLIDSCIDLGTNVVRAILLYNFHEFVQTGFHGSQMVGVGPPRHHKIRNNVDTCNWKYASRHPY